jgi:hypothetical protein
MTKARRIILAVFATLALVAAVSTISPTLARAQQGQKPQSMSGKISSIEKEGQGVLQDSFTLDVTEDQTVPFFMVPQTKVTGDMKIGNMADVTYVFDNNGNKVAVTIDCKAAAPAKK